MLVVKVPEPFGTQPGTVVEDERTGNHSACKLDDFAGQVRVYAVVLASQGA